MSKVANIPTPSSGKVTDSAIIGSKLPCLVPGPDYRADYYGFTTQVMYRGRPKLYLNFLVTCPGLSKPVPQVKYYNLGWLDNKNKRNFKFGIKSNLYRDYARVFGEPADLTTFTSDELLDAFEGKSFSCSIKVVTNDYANELLGKGQRYSAIERIEGIINE